MGFVILFGAAAWVGATVYAIGMLMIGRNADRIKEQAIDREREQQGLPPFNWEEQ